MAEFRPMLRLEMLARWWPVVRDPEQMQWMLCMALGLRILRPPCHGAQAKGADLDIALTQCHPLHGMHPLKLRAQDSYARPQDKGKA